MDDTKALPTKESNLLAQHTAISSNAALIEADLKTPIQYVIKQAQARTTEDLEGTNNVLKPYLKQLAGLKVRQTASTLITAVCLLVWT
jgi:hypothetical protein